MPISRDEWNASYFLGERQGYAPHIGALVGMLQYARLTTLQAVEGLGMAELDAIPPGFSNSVGMLLAHITATDRMYQAASFEDRDAYGAVDYAAYIAEGDGLALGVKPLAGQGTVKVATLG